QDGKSVGTIYVQDIGSTEPFSGTSLFSPSFVPGNLRVSALDVIDLRGQWAEAQSIGSAKFADGAVLPQMSKPTATFRYEVSTPPVPADKATIDDLADYKRGRQWLNMVVKISNVTLQKATASSSGRLSYDLLPAGTGAGKCDDGFPKPPSLTNELF